MAHRVEDYYAVPDGSLQGALHEQLGKTPWWMLSLSLHAVVAMVGYFVMFETVVERPPEQPPARCTGRGDE